MANQIAQLTMRHTNTLPAFCLASARIRPPGQSPYCTRLRLLRVPRKLTRRTFLKSSLPLETALKSSPLAHAFLLNSVLFVGANVTQQKVLTRQGLNHAFVLGVILWSCLSWQGYSLCFSFLLVGSLVTRVGRDRKEALGIAEKRCGARGPENLWGAAAVCAICALSVGLMPYLIRGSDELRVLLTSVFMIGYTSSLTTKFADTASSEIGKAYGSTTYLVTSLQRVPRGTEGAVSVEGTLAGIAAAAIASYYALVVGLLSSHAQVVICIVSSFIATTVESFIGATIQERLGWSNEFVNFVNTLVGAVVAMGLYLVFGV
ncbi:unnamed protein product [Agarophyton chilense]